MRDGKTEACTCTCGNGTCSGGDFFGLVAQNAERDAGCCVGI